MVSEIDAVVAGHLCVDVYPDLSMFESKKFLDGFLPGRLLNVGKISFSTGGTVSNAGQALHKLGIDTRLIGKVGDDVFGQVIIQMIENNHSILAHNIVKGKNESTSYTLVIDPPGIDRILLHCPGTNDTFNWSDIDYDLVARSRLFHFGYPPLMKMMYVENGKNLFEVVKRVKKTGATVSLDLALPDPNSPSGHADWEKILDVILPNVDIFLPSIEEITYMLRRDIYKKWRLSGSTGDISMLVTSDNLSILSDMILDRGVKIVVLKLGEYGLYVRTAKKALLERMGRGAPGDFLQWQNREIWSPCYKVNMVGTIGSGDATIAGFLAALLRGLTIEESTNMAVAVGACSVETSDTLSGILSWDQTIERINLNWKKNELQKMSDCWGYLPAYQLFERTH